MNFREKDNTQKTKLKDRAIILMKSNRKISTINLLIVIIIFFGVFLVTGRNLGFTEIGNNGYESLKDSGGKITFTGDVSPSRYLKEVSEKNGHDIYYKDIKNIWEDSDISLINLEASALTQDPEEVEYINVNESEGIYFDVNKEDIKAIKDSGINLIGYANNHSMSYGVQGMEESLKIFQDEEIEYIGAGKDIYEAIEPYTKEINKEKVGIMAISDIIMKGTRATTNIPGINGTSYMHRDYELEKMIRKNDFNIVYIHWGTEYVLKPTKEIKELGRELIDMGVDLVVGSHPHVLLPVEKYNDGMIIYSMGNLVFDQKTGRTTDSAIANLYLDDNGKFFEFVPIDIQNGIPHVTDKKRTVNRIFKSLTKELDKEDYKIEDNKLIINFE
ncbi:MAG TPA: CapA family protein [Tissierellaceae bacterium]|nr:CapA family protein [Tissierellaceae bacterium]